MGGDDDLATARGWVGSMPDPKRSGASFDGDGLEVIGRAECLARLAAASVGRLALSVQALPVVLPVDFVLRDGDLLLRTSGGHRLDLACDRAVVAFEADGYEPATRTGWTVLVQGTARVLRTPPELDAARRARVVAWASPTIGSYVRVGLDLVTGRRLGGHL